MLRRVLFLIYPGFELMDYAGPVSVFAAANRIREEAGEEAVCEILTLSAQGGLIGSGASVTVTALPAAGYRPRATDTLLIVGAGESPLTAAITDPVLLDLLRDHGPKVARWGSICSGTFLLAATGAIEGRRVATHWMGCERLARQYPGIEVDAQALYVVDGSLWTSAGVSTGIDMALEMLRRDEGSELMLAIARRLVLYAHRPGHQSQFSDLLSQQGKVADGFGDLLAWLEANLHHPIRVEDMAVQMRQTGRTFHRRFSEAFGQSPARYLEDLRLQRARGLLGDGARVKQACAAVGFRSEAAFRKAFEARFGVTPSMARQVHGAASRG